VHEAQLEGVHEAQLEGALAATRSIEGPLHADDGDRRQQHHADRSATHHQERGHTPTVTSAMARLKAP